ncbi:acetylglucosamine transferase [Verminephrobacter aporrectodeae subsp. tuberculatae]|uniref:O-linked N-acetylglucosamine transferase, SPINDLY family protein n=1 Tax=Verminephrobacter aporrectodeae TaxID=1110389 RepID=UPI002243EE83|nr:glycosyltransferase family 41 protein [Verminephrobacter aporrectodeae]MCW8206738.1 acetylglucosamine transferase [Verminephrobacter aporrectodeae subsp. tuberculatae]
MAPSLPKAPPSAHDGLRTALLAADWPLLARLCRQALRKNGRDLGAHRLLGFALHRQRRFGAARQAYQRASVLWPDDAELLVNHANVLIEQARNNAALPLLERLCGLCPEQAIVWIKLAECCYLPGLHDRGFAASQNAAARARTLHERAAALMQSAIHRRELGQIREAIEDSERAIALFPDEPGNHTNRLLFMLSAPQVDAAQLSAAAREYGAIFESPLRQAWPRFEQHRGAPWRRLRVGFLSPDFRMHSVMYFAEGLLARLDRRQFEVFAFHLFPDEDSVSARVQRHADHFVRLAGLDARQQAEAIRAQGIDILVDLAGHTGHNGLLALAHKAAPVQVSWLGFPATTGLQAVDYRFTDEITDPPDAQAQYTERLYRLPTPFACYRPMSRNPLWRYQPRYQVHPAPAGERGCVTFGSCNNLGKLSDEVLALWGRVLAATPGSRLLIEGKNLDRPDFADAYRQRCQGLGLEPQRLDLVALRNANQYLTYHRIDIALDPFPLSGGTTTFDALWMGLPVVSMVGASFKGRMGVSLLTHLGRSEWLAETPQDYVRIAQRLAADVPALNALRLGLRDEMERSALMREDLFGQHFGQGLRAMWLHWLARAEHPHSAQAQEQALRDWLPRLPEEWTCAPQPEVGIAPGQRISLAHAHARLQELVKKARADAPLAATPAAQITSRSWSAVAQLAETVLDAVAHDPVALSCLAEVENAHGHTGCAVNYLQHAARAMGTGLPGT